MQSRNRYVGGVLALLLFLGLAVSTEAVEYHIKKNTTGGTYYGSLEEMRKAIEEDKTLVLRAGDVIILHNDDTSLTSYFPSPLDAEITFRSEGGRWSVSPHRDSGIGAIFYPQGEPITVNFDNLIIDGMNRSTNGVSMWAYESELNISNSIIQNNSVGVRLEGDINATITNTIFRNNSSVNAIQVVNDSGDTTTINVALDANAPCYVAWESDRTATAITLNTSGQAGLNFDIAGGRKLDIKGMLIGDSLSYSDYDIVKTGAGVLKLSSRMFVRDYADYYTDENAEPDYHGGWNIHVKEGTLELGRHFRIDDPLVIGKDINGKDYIKKSGAAIRVDSGATFKVNITPGTLMESHIKGEDTFSADASRFVIGTFNSAAGSRLEVGGISLMPLIGENAPVLGKEKLAGAWYGLIQLGRADLSSVTGMTINNRLMEAALELCDLGNLREEDPNPENYNGIRLHVKKVNNLAILTGVGGYADIYRQLDTLSEQERDLLDSIYARGGTDGQSLGYLQSLGGSHVMLSSVAMRHNWAGVIRAISRRTTAFQKEELEEEREPQITGSNFCYNEDVSRVKYGQIWAYIDKSYMDQDDRKNMAGYKYAPAGVGVGYEHHREEWIYGGLLRYDSGDVKLKSNSATRTEVETLIASIYGSYASEGYYVSGGLHYGHGWNDSYATFNLPCYSASANTGDYSSRLFGANVEIGYMQNFEYGDTLFRFTPYTGLGYASIRRESVTEKGTGNQLKHFRQSQWDLWEWTAGVRFSAPFERENFTIIPSLDIMFNRTMGSPSNEHGDANLLANPAGMWKVDPLDSNRSALRVQAGVNARFRDNIDIGVNYEFEWRKQYWNNQFGLNLTVGF